MSLERLKMQLNRSQVAVDERPAGTGADHDRAANETVEGDGAAARRADLEALRDMTQTDRTVESTLARSKEVRGKA